MSEVLKQAIQSGDINLLEKYVDKYLPQDQKNLQRIYNQLQNYSIQEKETQNQIQASLFSKSILMAIINSPNSFSKKGRRNESNNIKGKSIEHSKNLIRTLKDKGINPRSDRFEDHEQEILQKGQILYEKACKKLINPMHPNIEARFLHIIKQNQRKLKLLFQKYEINQKLNTKINKNEEEGTKLQEQVNTNWQMIQFIKRRNQLLEDIQEKKQYEDRSLKKIDRFKSTQSRVHSAHNLRKYTRIHQYQNPNNIDLIHKPSTSQSLRRLERYSSLGLSAGKMMTVYKVQGTDPNLKDEYFHKLNRIIEQSQISKPKLSNLSISKSKIQKIIRSKPKNIFEELQEKAQNIAQENTDINQKTKKLAYKEYVNQYYNRYNWEYIQMLKPKQDSNKSNKYQRELLLDANRLRKVLIDQ